MANQTINVAVTCVNGTTSCSNNIINVRQPKNSQITINWNVSNGTFPSNLNSAFSWKAGFTGSGNLTRVNDGQIQLVYNIQTSGTWKYNITLNSCATFDPEIVNEVPPGDEEPPR
ncbi:MAG TPA: hypothetical protein VNA69_16790 [Thermoanaerobaculia bacterium]|nr:hypothetical protein [Thermoanaerobaculia bacterium]